MDGAGAKRPPTSTIRPFTWSNGFTIVDADNIDYEATIEDATVFTRPWNIEFRVTRRSS
jgi:hypothetical protein